MQAMKGYTPMLPTHTFGALGCTAQQSPISEVLLKGEFVAP
jgi:hypothetical protein